MGLSTKESEVSNTLHHAQDAISIAEIWPKLTPEQKHWIESLDQDERQETEEILKLKGEAYFFETFGFLKDQLEYVRSL